MPYDVSGNYTLPSPEFPLIPNTLADANAVNTIYSDIRTALGQVVLRSGVAAFTGQAKFVDGTQALPGISFSAEGGLGLYRVAAGVLAGVVANSEAFRYTATAFTFSKEPTYAADPTGANGLTRKSYVDGLISGLGSTYVAKAGDTMTGALVNTSTVKVGNGAAPNSARLMVNTLSGTAAGIQLFQDGNESWVMESVASSTALRWSNSGTERMRIDGLGNVGISTVPVGSNRLLEVGNNSRAATYIRNVSQTVGSVWFEALAAGYDTLLVGVNNSGGTVAGVPTGTSAVMVAGANPLIFGTAATERMRVDGSGNVGVGTAAPQGRLDVTVSGTGAGSGDLIVNTAANGNAGISLRTATVARFSITLAGTDGSNALRFRDENASVERMRIDAGGNVGIGATAPTQKLDVRGSILSLVGAGGGVLLGDSNNTVAVRSIPTGGDSAIGFYTQALSGNSERMRIDSSGNVGIGITNPSGWRLNINGSDTQALRLVNTASTGNIIDFIDQGWQAQIHHVSGELRFNTQGSNQRMVIAGDGKVGVGVANPDVALRVDSTGMARGILISGVAGNAAVGSQMMLSQSGVDTWAFGQPAGVSAFAIWSGRNPAADGTERMRISNTGLVSIGTTSPGGQLTIAGAQELLRLVNDAAYISFFNSAGGSRTGYIQSNTSGPMMIVQEQAQLMQFWVNGAARADITSGGVLRYGGIEVGYRGLPTASVATGAFAASDNGKRVKATAGVTIPNNIMQDGDIVHVLNTTGSAITITKSITTAYNKNTGAALGATFTLAARGSMTIEFTGGAECYVGGNIS